MPTYTHIGIHTPKEYVIRKKKLKWCAVAQQRLRKIEKKRWKIQKYNTCLQRVDYSLKNESTRRGKKETNTFNTNPLLLNEFVGGWHDADNGSVKWQDFKGNAVQHRHQLNTHTLVMSTVNNNVTIGENLNFLVLFPFSILFIHSG